MIAHLKLFIRTQNLRRNKSAAGSAPVKKTNKEAGFSLIEVISSMVILLIVLLGVFITFTYSINYNAGNSSRSQALSVLQREVEKMRSLRFKHDFTDPNLYGGIKPDRSEVYLNGNRFNVSVSIDNNPATPAIDANEAVEPSIKQIKITVALERPTPGWQTAVPISVILQRVRGN